MHVFTFIIRCWQYPFFGLYSESTVASSSISLTILDDVIYWLPDQRSLHHPKSELFLVLVVWLANTKVIVVFWFVIWDVDPLVSRLFAFRTVQEINKHVSSNFCATKNTIFYIIWCIQNTIVKQLLSVLDVYNV